MVALDTGWRANNDPNHRRPPSARPRFSVKDGSESIWPTITGMEEPLPAQINTPPDYRPLDPDDLIAVLAEVQVVAARLGGEPRDWQTEPLLGGNLNSLHVVRGPAGAICAKQALPYLRILGEGTPMPAEPDRVRAGSTDRACTPCRQSGSRNRCTSIPRST